MPEQRSEGHKLIGLAFQCPNCGQIFPVESDELADVAVEKIWGAPMTEKDLFIAIGRALSSMDARDARNKAYIRKEQKES